MFGAADKLRKVVNYYIGNYKPRIPHGVSGIKQVGYEVYIGGDYERHGEMQYKFCIEHGLKPNDVFADIACGALRLSKKLIPYLNERNYIGIDREQMLIDMALEHELDPHLVMSKKPYFIMTERVEFEKLPKKPTFCVAFSLFTHLDPSDIKLCLKNLRPHVADGAVFYATFSDSPIPIPQIYKSHSHRGFVYTHRQMRRFGEKFGWIGSFIG
ncbi:MAG: class I SAM-dependent methyltransferase, partial [Proteobacteria bacterium]|nr:class I SAM-dependent methyltransferase [Pseudomonadota bacterium]